MHQFSLRDDPSAPRDIVLGRSARDRAIEAGAQLMLTGRRMPTISDVAQTASLSRRAVYNHFPTPDQLRDAAIERLIRQLASRVPGDIWIWPRLLDMVDSAIRILGSRTNTQVVRVLVDLDPEKSLLPLLYASLVREPILRGVERQLLPADAPAAAPGLIAELIVCTIEASVVLPTLLGRAHVDDELGASRRVAEIIRHSGYAAL